MTLVRAKLSQTRPAAAFEAVTEVLHPLLTGPVRRTGKARRAPRMPLPVMTADVMNGT